MLMPLGFILREAGSGSECLNSVVESPPDAVLLDLTMDDPDGWTTADRLRQVGYSGPVLIVSANVFENQPRLLQLHDVQGFIGKPVMEGELLDWLERYLQIEWVEDYSSRAHISDNSHQVDKKTFERPPSAPVRLALRSAAKLGYLQGLHSALRQWAQDEPDHTHNLAWLRCNQWVETCDAQAVLFFLDQLPDNTDDGNE
jgi:CheY-like chemotaxis protein